MNDPVEQFEMLLSRRADGDLSPVEAAELDRALSRDSSAAATARSYERLQAVLADYRRVPELEWRALARRVGEQVRAASRADVARLEDAALDATLATWAGTMPKVDWAAFKSRVSAAVRAEAQVGGARVRRARVWQAARVWVTPLAVAAAITLVVLWPRRIAVDEHGTEFSDPLFVVTLDVPATGRGIAISFDKRAAPPVSTTTGEVSIAAITAVPGQAGDEENWEEAVLY